MLIREKRRTWQRNDGSMAVVYLCMGSNLKDRVGNIQHAVRFLNENKDIKIIRSSTLYETEPSERRGQRWFVNAILEIKTKLSPVELLRVTQDIEYKLGRNEIQDRYSPRIIDIDILFYDNKIFNNDFLKIPHERLHKRAFVLVPLLELIPDFVHPVLNKTITELHEALENPEDVLLYGTRLDDDDDDDDGEDEEGESFN